MTETIHSERLDLIPLTPEFLRTSLERDIARSERLLKLSLPPDWPDAPDFLALRLQQLETNASLQTWLVRAIGLRSQRCMVGHIGFHTAPGAEYLHTLCPGGVEFGFTVFPPFRRQGYAREASLALMRWAQQSHGVKRFVVSIRPDNVPSRALAAQLGFVRIGSHIDEVDGLEDIYEKRVSDANAIC
jgi:ribosomal-protein-alanine N-acetyltransferase